MDPIDEDWPSAHYECCGRRVSLERAVELVAISGIVSNILWGPYMAFTSPLPIYFNDVQIDVVAICLYVLLLVALNKQNCRLFIPYLLWMCISISFHTLYCLVIFFGFLLNGSFWDAYAKTHPDTNIDVAKFFMFIHLALNVMKLAVNVWFTHVVYRAYYFMKNQQSAQPLLA